MEDENKRIRHQNDNSEAIAATVVEAMDSLKGKEIVTLDLREANGAVTDYFVICHAASKTQVDAIADKVEDLVREKLHVKPFHIEGKENTEWSRYADRPQHRHRASDRDALRQKRPQFRQKQIPCQRRRS